MKPWGILAILALTVNANFAFSGIDSDSPDYNKMYDQLEADYIRDLKKTTPKPEINEAASGEAAVWKPTPEEEIAHHYNDEIQPEEATTTLSPAELYEIKTRSLKCDHPWFWNAFKCAWLDYWNNHEDLPRFKRNAKVGFIFWGIILSLLLCPWCVCIVTAIYMKSRIGKFQRKAEQYIEKMKPGVMIHPDGTKEEYEPTQEEQDALDNLLQVLATVV